MRFSHGLILSVVGIASAATTTSTAVTASSTCAAQNIVDACLGTTQGILDNCAPNDWGCMCDAQTQVVTCYNNCPGDPNGVTANQQLTSWCNAAKQYGTTSTIISRAAATSASTAAASGSNSAASATAASTATHSSTSTANAASGLVVPAGGVLAFALAFIGLL